MVFILGKRTGGLSFHSFYKMNIGYRWWNAQRKLYLAVEQTAQRCSEGSGGTTKHPVSFERFVWWVQKRNDWLEGVRSEVQKRDVWQPESRCGNEEVKRAFERKRRVSDLLWEESSLSSVSTYESYSWVKISLVVCYFVFKFSSSGRGNDFIWRNKAVCLIVSLDP